MDGSRRAASLLALVVALTGAATVQAVRPAWSASAPSVNATKVGDDVRIGWGFAARPTRSTLELKIDRRASTSGWIRWKTIDEPHTKEVRFDGSPRSGTSYYRVRLFDKGKLVGTSPSDRVVRPSSGARGTSGGGACTTARADVLLMVNQERAARQLGGLVAHSQLNTSAQVHSNEMARVQRLSHDNWIEEIRAAGYTRGTIGQNAAVGYPTSAAVMQGWMNSPGHRSNILSASYDEIGIGCTRDGTGTYWWTQNFGG